MQTCREAFRRRGNQDGRISDGLRFTGWQELVTNLDDDLEREYQAVMTQNIEHCRRIGACAPIAKKIDYLGRLPAVQPHSADVTEDNNEMPRADLRHESDTIGAVGSA